MAVSGQFLVAAVTVRAPLPRSRAVALFRTVPVYRAALTSGHATRSGGRCRRKPAGRDGLRLSRRRDRSYGFAWGRC